MPILAAVDLPDSSPQGQIMQSSEKMLHLRVYGPHVTFYLLNVTVL